MSALLPPHPPRPTTSAPSGSPAAGVRPVGRGRGGFTLLESALAVIIVGVGISALMALMGSLTNQNAVAGRMSTAMLLASHIQEGIAGLSFNDPAYAGTYFGPEPGEALANYNDIDDFDGLTLCPPIDAARQPIAGLGQYTQVITVLPVYGNKLNSNTNPASLDLPKTAYTGSVRVMVRVLYRRTPAVPAEEVYRSTWVRTDY